MNVFYMLLFILALVTGLPLSSPTASEIDFTNPFASKPIVARSVISQSMEHRFVESSFLETRQSTIPGAYIIEFKEAYSHDTFYAHLNEKNVLYKIRYVYNHPNIFMGVSIQLKLGTDYAKVAGWEGIAMITPVRGVTIPPLAKRATLPTDVINKGEMGKVVKGRVHSVSGLET